ncbi:MAG: ornithine cyclodeaminase family protein [Burkholderiales bacterium]|nr:ornithine cyclodeaminase family protein [Burkholderiales bacterium]
MTATLPYLPAADIEAALDYPSLVAALGAAFATGAQAPLRHVHVVAPRIEGRLLLMPAWRQEEALGVKLVTVFPANRSRGLATVAALFVLLDGATGHPRALLDGEALTLRRTAAASALASKHLSRSDSATLVVVGTGKLAPCMAAAHCAVRPIRRVLVWGRRRERAEALAADLARSGLPASPAAGLDAALAEADIVTCATTATEPVVRGAAVRPGTHVDLVGGFTPGMREADDALVAKAEVFVDTYAGALAEAGDLVQPIANGVITRDAVRAELAELVVGARSGRSGEDAITLFKSVGTALEDLAAAELAVSRLAP